MGSHSQKFGHHRSCQQRLDNVIRIRVVFHNLAHRLGDGDELLAVDKNAEALARKLPQTPEYKLLAGAGHFVFMAPCSDEQRATAPVVCTDRDGVDREDIHRNLSAEAVRFFEDSLGMPELHNTGLQTAHQQ